MPEPSVLVVLGVAVLVGALVQSSVGFGIVVVAAPFVVWLAPELMPGSMLVCGFAMPLMQLTTGPRDIDWPSLRSALGARLLLTPVGVWLVAVSSTQMISAMVGALILLSALVSASAPAFEATPRNLLVAGALTGVSGTSAAVGGPFVALTLQHESPVRIRSTLAAFFSVGSLASMLGLVVAGEFSREQLLAGLCFVPFLALGYACSGPVTRRLSAASMRVAVVGFCLVSGVSILLRAALG